MSTTKRFDNTLDFHPERDLGAAFWHLPTTVMTYWSAIRDGLAAARAYHELTSHGATHEAAVEKVFGQHLNVR